MRAEFLGTSKPAKWQAVRLGQVGTQWVSVPVSASPYFLPEADGIVIDSNRVATFPSDAGARRQIVLAGCDPATSLLADMVERAGGVEVVHAPASSELALRWLKEGKVHIAGSHLEDPKTAEFNLPFIHREFGAEEIGVITFAEWEEGFVVAKGNPKRIRTVGDLQRKNVWFINRQPGSGSRLLLDKLLREANIAPRALQGYHRVAVGHLAAAYAVVSGDADCCLATRSAARAFSLAFVPVHSERYDFVFRRSMLESPAVQTFMDVLQRASLRRRLETLAGYDTRKTGARIA
jgi:molybdate-binding protein